MTSTGSFQVEFLHNRRANYVERTFRPCRPLSAETLSRTVSTQIQHTAQPSPDFKEHHPPNGMSTHCHRDSLLCAGMIMKWAYIKQLMYLDWIFRQERPSTAEGHCSQNAEFN